MTIHCRRDPVLYIDCTSSLRSGLGTGVQKVVWALVEQVDVFEEVLGIECIPIAYQYNAFYRLSDAGCVTLETQDNFTTVEFFYRDIYFCPDAFWTFNMSKWYSFLRERGVSIATLIYDLIPSYHPEFSSAEDRVVFDSALSAVIEHSQLLLCISNATKRDLLSYCARRVGGAENCAVIPLAPALRVLSSADGASKRRLPSKPFFLMVGSVEPRRGYSAALSEFRAYWAAGGDKQLLVIGKLGGEGMLIGAELSAAIKEGLPLIWLSDASDDEVASAYLDASAVVCASYAEGYGMSVSEGLAYNGLVLANRLEVFGEFAGSLPYYFEVDVEGELVKLLLRVDELKRSYLAGGIGSWEETARLTAGHLSKISPSHGSHTGIELDRISFEAVRWACWLNRIVVDKAALEHYSSYKSVSEMYSALCHEARRPDGPLSADVVRWAYSLILGRDSCSDDDVAFWLSRCATTRELTECLLFEVIKTHKKNIMLGDE